MNPSNKIKYNSGDKIGACIYIKDMPSIKWERYALFKCECGNEFVTLISSVKRGSCNSCGCLGIQKRRDAVIKHNMSKTPEYKAWARIKDRCFNKNLHNYKNWGGRGITMCDEWLNSFDNFYADMGPRPSSTHSLDRINNDGNYCK